MGSFGGHALPGTLFFIFGFWQTISALNIFYKRQRQGKRYFGHVAFPLTCCCCTRKTIPWEGIIKVIGTVFGMCVEGVGFFWHVPAMIQHFTMYAFFLMAGIVDILQHYQAPLPPNLDYLIHTLAFLVEGLLFYFHLHGRSHLDITIHTLLVYACLACAAAFLMELRYRNSVLPPLTRGYFIMLQGTWFWQAGFILYNPFGLPWDEKDHANIMVTTIVAGWHMIAIFALQLIVCSIMGRVNRSTISTMLNNNKSTTMGTLNNVEKGNSEENNGLLGHSSGNEDDDDDDAL